MHMWKNDNNKICYKKQLDIVESLFRNPSKSS